MPKAGVYAIQNIATGRTYVGSTVHIARRWAEHRSMLRRREHQAHEFQVDWDLYGESAFVFMVLERIDDAEARIFCEQMHIDRLVNPYNVNERAGSGPKAGYKHSKESIQKMSRAQLGRKKSAAHRAAISAGRKGMILSPEHRANIGLAGKGKKRTVETRRKIREALLKLSPHTYGAKISASKRGKPNPKQGIAMNGKPWSAKRREVFELSRLKTEA